MPLSTIRHIRGDIFEFSPLDGGTYGLRITDPERADQLLGRADGVTIWNVWLDEQDNMVITKGSADDLHRWISAREHGVHGRRLGWRVRLDSALSANS